MKPRPFGDGLIFVCNAIGLIPLGGKKGHGLYAVVDLADIPLVAPFYWHLNDRRRARCIYAQTNIKRAGRMTTIQMHKLIFPEAQEIDHHDGNGLNNRRSNLRVSSSRANKQNRFVQRNNTSGYRGVNRFGEKWMARVGKGRRGVRAYLGLFETAQDAAHAYDDEARRRFREFARLNFPRPGEQSAQSSSVS